MENEQLEKDLCSFKKYTKQTLDLMVDSYKWKKMGEYCDDIEIKNKYDNISNVLMELFMKEHENIADMFRK